MIGVKWFVLRGVLIDGENEWDIAIWGHPYRMPHQETHAIDLLLQALHNAQDHLFDYTDRSSFIYEAERIGLHPVQSQRLQNVIEAGGSSAVAWIAAQPLTVKLTEDNHHG